MFSKEVSSTIFKVFGMTQPGTEPRSPGSFANILSTGPMSWSWGQHPTKQQLYSHQPPIMKTIKIRRTRHAGHCWRRREELVSDVLLWTPAHGRANAGRPVRTYIQQLCADTKCSLKDLPKAMDDREVWRETARNIRANSVTWWWWWWWWWWLYSIMIMNDFKHTRRIR